MVLTKPLGTQIACKIHQWLDVPEKLEKISSVISVEEIKFVYKQAVLSMARQNRIGEEFIIRIDTIKVLKKYMIFTSSLI